MAHHVLHKDLDSQREPQLSSRHGLQERDPEGLVRREGSTVKSSFGDDFAAHNRFSGLS